MERDLLGNGSLDSKGRIDRSHPPLCSGFPIARLPGIQMVEARATDLAALTAIQVLGGRSGVEEVGELKRLTDGMTSLEHLEVVLRERYGSRLVRRLKVVVGERFGHFKDVGTNGCEFAVREALSGWALQGIQEGRSISEKRQARKQRRRGRGRAGKTFSS